MIKKLRRALLIAAAGAVAASAQAATTSYQLDDLFLGFTSSAPGVTQDYLINIGQASGYRDLAAGNSFVLNIGNIFADIAAVFGNNWYNDPNLRWGVVGTPGPAATAGDGANLLYATKPEPAFGTGATPYNRDTSGTQGLVRSDIITMEDAYAGKTSTANSSVGLIQLASDANSWASFNPGGQSFSYFTGMEATFASGFGANALDLFRMAATTTSGLPGTYEGSFFFRDTNADGIPDQLVFQNGLPIPEPATYQMLALGASSLSGLVILRRRRALRA